MLGFLCVFIYEGMAAETGNGMVWWRGIKGGMKRNKGLPGEIEPGAANFSKL